MVLTGLVYGVAGLWTGHFRRGLSWPREGRGALTGGAPVSAPCAADEAEERSYNVLQRTAYLGVIFVLFPLVIWTGLAMSPAFTAAFRRRRFAWRAAIGAHDAFLRSMDAGALPGGTCGDDCDGRILEPHAGNDYWPRGGNGGASMSPISRRKLIAGGVAAVAGVSGLVAAAGWRGVRIDSAGWPRLLWTRRDDDLRGATASGKAFAGARVSAQHDFEEAVCQ